MKSHSIYSLALASGLAVIAASATAATVSSVSVVDTSSIGSEVLQDTATDGDASVNGLFGTFATQNADGTSEVRAATDPFGGERKVTSTAAFEQSETNTFGMDRDYTLSYELTGQQAEFNVGFFVALAAPQPGNGGTLIPTARSLAFPAATNPALPATTTSRTSGIAPTDARNPFTEVDDPEALAGVALPITAASFEYIIQVNGETKFNARADALLDGFDIAGGLIFDAVDGFSPTAVSNGNGGFVFNVGEISGDIFLGTKKAGEVIEVTSTLIARAYSGSFFGDGQEPVSLNTFSSDPINLSSVGINFTSTPTNVVVPPVVPLPAAGWMLIAAIGGLGVAAKRKKA